MEKPGRVQTSLRVNGETHELLVEPRRTLLDVLRHDLGLTGAKKSCDEGTCGACTVIVDGRAQYACLLLAVDCDDREIRTVEGLAQGEVLDPVQEAFIQADAFQCGYCTPGQVMAMRALLDQTPEPTDEEITRGMAGNLCRCGAYQHIFAAAKKAVEIERTREANQ